VDSNPTIYFTTMDGNNITYFKNTRNVPNTGIRMDVIPYAVTILGIVIVAGAFVIVARKRRNAR
jgi:LPXTG-motif cell wall-anchored protein